MAAIIANWKKIALAGFVGLGLPVAVTPTASAHQVFTRCDSDGDRCWRVICDDDGDDCHRLPDRWNDHDWRYYNRQRYDYDRYYNDNYYDRNHYRRLVCDRDGDRCR